MDVCNIFNGYSPLALMAFEGTGLEGAKMNGSIWRGVQGQSLREKLSMGTGPSDSIFQANGLLDCEGSGSTLDDYDPFDTSASTCRLSRMSRSKHPDPTAPLLSRRKATPSDFISCCIFQGVWIYPEIVLFRPRPETSRKAVAHGIIRGKLYNPFPPASRLVRPVVHLWDVTPPG